ncbi:MAG: putative sulfate exporter family transporter [Deltaproteobacteria bacterium]|nr:putative sulfate exporter family transporter [Deltaproteobacteria bacterium]
MSNGGGGWSVLWKTEDWLAVWIGFLIIILSLVGMSVVVPKFKWVTEGEFTGFCAEAAPQMQTLAGQAGAKGESGLQTAATALKAALDKKDRKAVSDEVKKFEAAVKDVKDKDLKKKAGGLAKEAKDASGNVIGKLFTADNMKWSIYIGIGMLILSVIAMALMGHNVGLFILGFPVVYIITWIALFVAGNYTINVYGLEYVIWCLVIGLFISNVIGLPAWLKPAVQTEFYIKTGLVILGAGILFKEILEAGALGIIQALCVVAVVWYFCYWLCQKLGVDDDFSAILSSAVSICGVSAAIATSGAIKGDPKKLSYTTSLVLVCAVPMMVLQPLISKWFGIPDEVAGAWLGGTLDTSGSVVAAGSLISDVAMKVGVIVKMSQNVLIGVAAFILAVVWTFKTAAEVPGGEKPGVIEIWNRFPKFVLGFLAASILFSFFLNPSLVGAVKSQLGGLRVFWFALAFTSIGLETNFRELVGMGGGRPAAGFLIAQGFNVIWTLILAYLLFGGILFAAPKF